MRCLKWMGMIGGILVCGIIVCIFIWQHDYRSVNSEIQNQEEVVLNNRQKYILGREGLSTDYADLSASQQQAILAIEELLTYGEVKYNVPFSYLEYTPQGIMERESVTAFPTKGSAFFEQVTLERYKEGDSYVYFDDYIKIAVRPYYMNLIQEYVNAYFSNDSVKIYSMVTKTALETVGEVSEETVIGAVEGSNWIFLDASVCGLKAFEEFVSAFGNWMKENKFYGSNQVLLLDKEQDITAVTEYNYREYLEDGCCQTRTNCDINKNGSINIY